MAGRKLKKEEMRRDPFREFLARTFAMTENSLEHHWQAYAGGFIVVIAAVAGIYYYIDHSAQKKDASSALMSEIVDTAEAPVLPAGAPERAEYLKNGMKVFTTSDERSAELRKKIDELNAKGASGYQEKGSLYLKASDLARAGSYSEAVKILDGLEKDSKFAPLALGLKARISELQNDPSKAESIYTQLSKIKGETFPEPMGLTMLGEFYERRGKKAEAVAAYEEALKVIAGKREKITDKKEQPQSMQQKDAMETKLRDRVKELKA